METALLVVVVAAGAALFAEPGGATVTELSGPRAFRLESLDGEWVTLRTVAGRDTCAPAMGVDAELVLHARRDDLLPEHTRPLSGDGPPCAPVAGSGAPSPPAGTPHALSEHGVDGVLAQPWTGLTWPGGGSAGQAQRATWVELDGGHVEGHRFCGRLPPLTAPVCVEPPSWTPAMLARADLPDDLRVVEDGGWVRRHPDADAEGLSLPGGLLATEVERRDGWVHLRTLGEDPGLVLRAPVLPGFVLDLWALEADVRRADALTFRGRSRWAVLRIDGVAPHVRFAPGAPLLGDDGTPAGTAGSDAALPTPTLIPGPDGTRCAVLAPDGALGGLTLCAAEGDVGLRNTDG